MYRKNKGVFIVFTHTMQKNQMGHDQIQERCEFVDRLRNRHNVEATVILELEEGRIVKNRTDHDVFEDYLDHARKSYPTEFEHLLKVTDLEEKYSLTKEEDSEIIEEELEESDDED